MAAIIGGVPITGFVSPTDSTDTYPTHDDIYGKGGFRVVADNTERDAIPADRRKEGMWVKSIAAGTTYELDADLVSWTDLGTSAFDPSLYMAKADYASATPSRVLDSELLLGQTLAYILSRTNHTGTQAMATITGLAAALAAKLDATAVGTTVAQLVAGVVPLAQLPFATTLCQGIYNGNTNTPLLANGVGTAGYFYITTVAGNAGPAGAVVAGQMVVYDGAVWAAGPVFSGGIAQLITALGTYTGASVTINNLDHFNDSATRFAVSADEKNALSSNPNPLNATNYAAGINDVYTWFNPQIFSDGQTLGDGTSRTLTSLGYNNGTAAATWPRVAADPRFTVNVNTMTIDWIACQEAFLTMEATHQHYITSVGQRSYITNQSLQLPRLQTSIPINQRSREFYFDWKTDQIRNLSGTDFPIITRDIPTTQADTSLNGYNQYSYIFENFVIYGRKSSVFDMTTPSSNDTGFQLACAKQPIFRNCKVWTVACGFDMIFSLNPNFYDCSVQEGVKYDVLLRGADPYYDTDTVLIAGPGQPDPDWNAATNTPAISDATGSNGYFWLVEVGGTRNLGSGSITMAAGGVLIHNGLRYVYYPPLWDGASPNNSQSNKAKLYDFYSYVDNTGLGVMQQASIANYSSGQLDIQDPTFEGAAAQRTFIIDINNMRSGTCKQLGSVRGAWHENTGAARAAVRVKADGGMFSIRDWYPQGSLANLPVLVESSNISSVYGINSVLTREIYYNLGWKFRNRGNQGWNVKSTVLNNRSNFYATENWATDFGGTIPNSSLCIYENNAGA
jgi:hypothetical protein